MNIPKGISYIDNDEVRYMIFDGFQNSGNVIHGFSTRIGGVSMSPFDSLNLGLTSGDNKETVLKNRYIFSNSLGYYPNESIYLEHGNKVQVIDEKTKDSIEKADAVITTIKNLPLTIFYADCVPVFILDLKTPSIGLIHAGWRGTVGNITGQTLLKMKEKFGTNPSDCIAGIAPSIGPCCFIVDEDVAGIFLKTFGEWKDLIRKTSNKWSIDLWEINRRQLLIQGVSENNITTSAICTSCSQDLFFSFRRDNRLTGRMAGLIVLFE